MKPRRSWWYFLALLFAFSIITRGCFDLFRVDWNSLFPGNGVGTFLARTFLPIIGVMAIVGGIVAAFYLSSKGDSHKYIFARVLWIGIFPAIVLAAPYLISRTNTTSARISRENVHALSCASPSQTHWSSDSLVALCLPPEFVVVQQDTNSPFSEGRSYSWSRGTTYPNGSVSVAVMRPPRGIFAHFWPPTIATPLPPGTIACADCYTVEDLVVENDSVPGARARVETGFRTGGIEGRVHVPTLVAGWKLPGQRYVVLNISAEQATTRDSLKAILHTVAIGNY